MQLLAKILDLQYLITCLAHLVVEQYRRVLTVRWAHLVQFYLVQRLLTAGSLLRLRRIGREAGNELLQLGDLVFGFLVLVAALFQQQLARLIPERIVTGKYGDFSEINI